MVRGQRAREYSFTFNNIFFRFFLCLDCWNGGVGEGQEEEANIIQHPEPSPMTSSAVWAQ